MFVTPNFTINTDNDATMISLSEDEKGNVNAYYISENTVVVKKKIMKPDKFVLAELRDGKAFYMGIDGSLFIDFIEN